MTIIGIGHVARVGKDTAATALVRDLGYRRVGFADALKDLALDIDPKITSNGSHNVGLGRDNLRWIVGGMGWEAAKDAYPEIRRFLENLGQACRDRFGENFWVDQALVVDRSNIVIPDVRHLNEAEAIHELGGKVIRIDRPGHKANTLKRPSEKWLLNWDGWDAVIENNGDVQQLEGAVVAWVKAHASASVPSPRV